MGTAPSVARLEFQMSNALARFKVADFSLGVAGPYTGQMLAHHGAEVIKIEPLEGDWSRDLGRQYGDLTAFSVHYNRGKRSLSLNMKSEEGRTIALKIAGQADIVIESFRPGVMKKFGLDYDAVRPVNERVIYLSITGFGQRGSNAQVPATDGIIQAYSGMMSMNMQADGLPQRFPMIFNDVVGGIYGFSAVTAALLGRAEGGKGQYIDCSLLQSSLALQAPRLVQHKFEDGRPEVKYVPLGVIRTKDSFISISVHRDEYFAPFCDVIERPDLAADPRFKDRLGRVTHESEIMKTVREIFLTRNTQEWAERLTKVGVLHAIIKNYDDVLGDSELRASGYIDQVHQHGIDDLIPAPNTPGTSRAMDMGDSPHVGEHSVDILRQFGFAQDTIDDLLRRKVVKQYGSG